MIVKICGITNLQDARAAVDGGAAALGFIFWPHSPRYIEPERAAEIIAALPAHIWKVGVFVDQPDAADLARTAGVDIVQLHGNEAPADFPEGFRIWKAARVVPGFDLECWEECPAEALLLDGPAGSLYGGAGTVFDWRVARGAAKKIVLAGGLDAANVRAAIEEAHPWAVDACSRIECAPGRKDRRKLAAFLKAALEPL
jgi:phosphoribosylanthranilate isomerase